MSRPGNFSWFVNKKVAGLSYPSNSEDITFLAEQGVKTLVSLCESGRPGYAEKAETLGIKLVSIPIVDFTPPTMEQIEEFLQILASASEPVAVHCFSGCGRTGTMFACYLVAVEDYSAERAIAETRRRRRGSIETKQQEETVHNFFRKKNCGNY